MRKILVGQSGGPTAAINASLSGVLDGARGQNITCMGMRHGIAGLLDKDVVNLNKLIPDTQASELLAHTPASWLGSCRYKLPSLEDESADKNKIYQEISDTLDEMEIDAFLYIGGNDSMDTIAKLAAWGKAHAHERCYIGVPKTIDNDLVGIDHTPGFGSAAQFVVQSLIDLRLDADVYGVKNVLVTEIMGRDAGWLTLFATAGGADIIVLPEFACDFDTVATRTRALLDQKDTVIIAVSEGAKTQDGTLYCDFDTGTSELDAFGHRAQQSGACRALASYLKAQLNVKTRAIEFSTLQRCASFALSHVDIEHAHALGAYALNLANQGKTGCMASLKRIENPSVTWEFVDVRVEKVANKIRYVDAHFYDEKNLCATEAARAYIAPLIDKPLNHIEPL